MLAACATLWFRKGYLASKYEEMTNLGLHMIVIRFLCLTDLCHRAASMRESNSDVPVDWFHDGKLGVQRLYEKHRLPLKAMFSMLESGWVALNGKSSGDVCGAQDGDPSGCKQKRCRCSWYNSCYPKFTQKKEDIGECSLSMPVLFSISVTLLLCIFISVIATRIKLQILQWEKEEFLATRLNYEDDSSNPEK